ncbi:hypothetical protein ACHMW7_04750 [Aminobacter sp. UC22_36]
MTALHKNISLRRLVREILDGLAVDDSADRAFWTRSEASTVTSTI